MSSVISAAQSDVSEHVPTPGERLGHEHDLASLPSEPPERSAARHDELGSQEKLPNNPLGDVELAELSRRQSVASSRSSRRSAGTSRGPLPPAPPASSISQLPPTDRGRDAYMVLAAAFVAELVIWGLPSSCSCARHVASLTRSRRRTARALSRNGTFALAARRGHAAHPHRHPSDRSVRPCSLI